MSMFIAAGSIMIMALALSVICRTFADHRGAVIAALRGELPPQAVRRGSAPARPTRRPAPAPSLIRVAA